MKPLQESSHPYTDDAVQTGHVRIAGAEGLRVEFDRQVGNKAVLSISKSIRFCHIVIVIIFV